MGKKAFEKIKAGLEAAIAYEAGDKTRGRIVKVRAAKLGRVDIKAVRRAQDLTQDAFALKYGIKPATLKRWEQNGTPEDGHVAAYLKVIAKSPDRVAMVLAGEGKEGKRVAKKATTRKRRRTRTKTAAAQRDAA